MDRRRLLLSAAIAAALAVPDARCLAHDFWIAPSNYRPAAGELVQLQLRVGQHFLGDALPRDPALLRRFEVFGAGKEPRPVPGLTGRDPAGLLRPLAGDGTLVVVYESGPTTAELTPDKLALYLQEEGLQQAAAAMRRPAKAGTVHDAFSRHVKAILQVPGGPHGGFDRVVGTTLELVPQKDPYAMAGGGALPLRLTFQGRPLAGVVLTAIPRLRPKAVVQARTDARGAATLTLGAGEWLIKAVHLVAADAGSGADYRSYWTALTFRFPEPAP